MHIPPPVPFLAAWTAQWLLARRRATSGPTGAASKTAAVGVATASLTLMAATVLQFGKSDTTLDPGRPERASSLVVTGPNRLSRNPIYLGFAGLLAAHAIWKGSALALLPVAGFMAAVTPQIEQEEEALLRRFGSDYARYSGRVPRWCAPGS